MTSLIAQFLSQLSSQENLRFARPTKRLELFRAARLFLRADSPSIKPSNSTPTTLQETRQEPTSNNGSESEISQAEAPRKVDFATYASDNNH